MGYVKRLLDRIDAYFERKTLEENERRFKGDVKKFHARLGVACIIKGLRIGKHYVETEKNFLKLWGISLGRNGITTQMLAEATGRNEEGINRFLRRHLWPKINQ